MMYQVARCSVKFERNAAIVTVAHISIFSDKKACIYYYLSLCYETVDTVYVSDLYSNII